MLEFAVFNSLILNVVCIGYAISLPVRSKVVHGTHLSNSLTHVILIQDRHVVHVYLFVLDRLHVSHLGCRNTLLLYFSLLQSQLKCWTEIVLKIFCFVIGFKQGPVPLQRLFRHVDEMLLLTNTCCNRPYTCCVYPHCIKTCKVLYFLKSFTKIGLEIT